MIPSPSESSLKVLTFPTALLAEQVKVKKQVSNLPSFAGEHRYFDKAIGMFNRVKLTSQTLFHSLEL